MAGENPILSFPCSIEEIKEQYDSVGLIQELDGHVIISTDGEDIYLVNLTRQNTEKSYGPILLDGKDISSDIKGVDSFKSLVTLEGGVVSYDSSTGELCKHGEYYIGYDAIDNRDPECKVFSFNNGVLQQEGIMLFNCNGEIHPFIFNGEDISREVSGINVSSQREDTVTYKGACFLFDQIKGELRSWSGYAVKYEPNDSDAKRFYQLYNVSGETAKKSGYILIKSDARNPESIFESARSIALNGTSVSEQITEVRNRAYNGIEVKYKGIWVQVDQKSAAIKTYKGLAYGVNDEVKSVNAPQHFYKLYNFDTEEPLVCGYGVGMEDNEFIPITLNGEDVSRRVSEMSESSPDKSSDEAMTLHGRVHAEIDGVTFSIAPLTGEVITLKGHPINLVNNGVNVFKEGEDGYKLEEENNRFDLTLGGKRISQVLEFDRSPYKYDIHAVELDGIRISVDNETCELRNIVDPSGKQFLYCIYPNTTVYYFVNKGKLIRVQDDSKITELEGLRKGTPEMVLEEANDSAMRLL